MFKDKYAFRYSYIMLKHQYLCVGNLQMVRYIMTWNSFWAWFYIFLKIYSISVLPTFVWYDNGKEPVLCAPEYPLNSSRHALIGHCYFSIVPLALIMIGCSIFNRSTSFIHTRKFCHLTGNFYLVLGRADWIWLLL